MLGLNRTIVCLKREKMSTPKRKALLERVSKTHAYPVGGSDLTGEARRAMSIILRAT
jgi:hypothetical protein